MWRDRVSILESRSDCRWRVDCMKRVQPWGSHIGEDVSAQKSTEMAPTACPKGQKAEIEKRGCTD